MMRSYSKFSSIGRRYARAIFDLSLEEGKVVQTAAELAGFEEALTSVPSLLKVLQDKEVTRSSKQGVVREVVRSLSLSPLVCNALLLIMEKGRMGVFGTIVRSYGVMAEAYSRTTHVSARVAEGRLAEVVKRKVEEVLAKTLKKEIFCDAEVDPTLFGGAVIRIGDVSLDASIAGRLKKMEEELL